MKNKKITIVSIALLLFTLTVGFVNKPTTFDKQLEMLCGKNWTPLKNGIPNQDVQIKYHVNHQYTLSILPKPNMHNSGETILYALWLMDEIGKIHIITYDIEKIVTIEKITDDVLILNIDDILTEYHVLDTNINMTTEKLIKITN